MTGTTELRAAITGLIGLAATEEEMLLASAPDGKDGSPDRWAAAPLVAHNTEFRQQQVARLEARYLGVPTRRSAWPPTAWPARRLQPALTHPASKEHAHDAAAANHARA